MEQWLVDLLLGFVKDHAFLATLLLVQGVGRAIFKPLVALLDAYVLATPATTDDEWERSFKEGKLYWLLDYVLSIKIPEPTKNQ